MPPFRLILLQSLPSSTTIQVVPKDKLHFVDAILLLGQSNGEGALLGISEVSNFGNSFGFEDDKALCAKVPFWVGM